MTRTLAASLLATLAILTATAPADAKPIAGAHRSADAVVAVATARGHSVKVRGRLGYGRTYTTAHKIPKKLRVRFRREAEGEAEEEGSGERRVTVPRPPAVPPTLDAGGARLAAANDFQLFRSTLVASGAGVTSATGEPTVANDRNSLLYTGNQHAAVSADNGETWRAIVPSDSRYYPQYDGGFCCDQIAYAVDRGANSLVFWLRQFRNDGALNPSDGANGRVSLIVFQGRKELLHQPELISQNDYCEYDFKPSDFGKVANSWFDFNQMSNTKKYLYISSKAQKNLGDTDGDGSPDSSFIDGVVWRIALDDLDDDDCGSTKVTYWSGVGTGFNSSLVQGADDESVMHWAFPGSGTDEIVFTRVKDGSKTGTVFTKSITPYLDTERPTASSNAKAATCPLPDGSDPCQRVNDKINTGYRAPGEVGWFWNVRQGPDRPFPHVRGVRFTPGPNPTLISEPDIWNAGFAWIYPSVGVNALGHVGISAYNMGGGRYPKAAVALVDDVVPDTDWTSLTFHNVRTSTSGANTWGDYQSVRGYGDCPNTFAGSVQTMATSSEHRFVWFGRERDACPDLITVDVSVSPTDVGRGQTVTIGHSIRNTGSATAPGSNTRFYWSRDAFKSADDSLIADTTSSGAVAPATTTGMPIIATSAPTAIGPWYLLACADGDETFDEISDTNNCLAAPDTVSVTVSGHTQAVGIDYAGTGHVVAHRRVRLAVQLRQPPHGNRRRVAIYLASRTKAGRKMRRLGTIAVARNRSGKAARVRAHGRLRLPRRAPRTRRQFLLACIGKPARTRCVVARRPLFVTRARR